MVLAKILIAADDKRGVQTISYVGVEVVTNLGNKLFVFLIPIASHHVYYSTYHLTMSIACSNPIILVLELN